MKEPIAAVFDKYMHQIRLYDQEKNFNKINTYDYLRGTPAVLSLALGVLFALFVTLFLVPSLYCVGNDITTLAGKGKRFIRRFINDTNRSKPVTNEH